MAPFHSIFSNVIKAQILGQMASDIVNWSTMKALHVMDEVIPQPRIRWPVLTSALLHLSLAALLLVRVSHQTERVPIGVDLLYLGEPRTISAPSPVKASTKSRKAESAESAPVQAEASPQVHESTAEVTSEGPVGRQDGVVVSVLERYKYELRLFLESRKIYPETARRLRQTGRVIVQFTIDSGGGLSQVHLEQGSSSEILNRAAVDLVRGASRFKPIPAEAQTQELQLSIPIEYIL